MKLNLAAFIIVFAVAGAGFPQAPPAGPPKLVRVFREEVAVGKAQAHADFEAKYVEAFRSVGWPVNYLALQSFTGPQEAWFLEGYDSWAALGKAEADMEKQPALEANLRELGEKDAAFLSKMSSFVLKFREDLSYRAGSVNLAKMRFMAVTIVRVKPGMSEVAEEAIKMLAAGYEKAGVTDFHWALYQGVSGLSGPTYIAMRPLGSLVEMEGSFSEALKKAEGEEALKKRVQHVRESYSSSESRLFSFSPKMSYVRKEFIDEDPAFWTPKPKAPAAAVAPKKKTK
jgi:hypothetical protein